MAYKKVGLRQPHLDSLRQLQIIDQVGFPLILSTSSRSYPLSSVKGFAKYGDFNNLAWMADAIQHGYVGSLHFHRSTNTSRYAMDWNQAKKAWGEQYITSFVDLSHLLSVCPVSLNLICKSSNFTTGSCSVLDRNSSEKLGFIN